MTVGMCFVCTLSINLQIIFIFNRLMLKKIIIKKCLSEFPRAQSDISKLPTVIFTWLKTLINQLTALHIMPKYTSAVEWSGLDSHTAFQRSCVMCKSHRKRKAV